MSEDVTLLCPIWGSLGHFPTALRLFKNTGLFFFFFPCEIVTLSPPSFGKSTKLDNYPFVSHPLTQLLNTVSGVSSGSGGEGAGKTSRGKEGLEGRKVYLWDRQSVLHRLLLLLLFLVWVFLQVQPTGVCQFPTNAAGGPPRQSQIGRLPTRHIARVKTQF